MENDEDITVITSIGSCQIRWALRQSVNEMTMIRMGMATTTLRKVMAIRTGGITGATTGTNIKEITALTTEIVIQGEIEGINERAAVEEEEVEVEMEAVGCPATTIFTSQANRMAKHKLLARITRTPNTLRKDIPETPIISNLTNLSNLNNLNNLSNLSSSSTSKMGDITRKDIVLRATTLKVMHRAIIKLIIKVTVKHRRIRTRINNLIMNNNNKQDTNSQEIPFHNRLDSLKSMSIQF